MEAYYQYAARAAGTTVQASLDATLKSSTICTKLAENSTAYGIMANKYKSSLTSYIDSSFSDGLNLLNYKCGAKCYIYHEGNQCSNITGGWTNWSNGIGGVTPSFLSNRILITIPAGSRNGYACGGAITKSSISLSSYRTLSTVIQSANDGAGWTAPAYKMQTGIASSYSTSIDPGTGAYGYAACAEANNGSLYPSKTTLSCSIASLSKGYGIFGLNQGYGSNNNMYHTWHTIALIP